MRLPTFSRILVLTLIASATFAHPARADEAHAAEGKKKIKVFLFAGQSNMEGRADGRLLVGQDRARLEAVQSRIQFAFNGKSIRPLDIYEPSAGIRKSYKRDRMFGPELFFGITLAEAWPDEEFLFIKRTQGGTSLHGCWNPAWSEDKAALMEEEKKPKLYYEFIAHTWEVLGSHAPDDYELCAMFWVQGESDSGKPVAASAYGATLRTLIECARSDLEQPDLPFMLFQVGSGEVVEGMKHCADVVPRVTLLPQSQDSASLDFYDKMQNGHYNYEGMKKLGTRFAETYLREYAAR